MLRRILSLILLVWVLGFIAFAVSLPGSAPADQRTDGIVVLTGGEGRIARGLAVLRRRAAGRMLVSGVDPEVREPEFSAQYHVEPALMRCCITLGYAAVDTRSNAAEAAGWIAEGQLKSVRLVTADTHMRRAAYELQLAIPLKVGLARVTVIEDAVASHPSFNTLFLEYCKLLARHVVRLWR